MITPPRRNACFPLCSVLILAGSLVSAPSAHAQEFYREVPGVRVFSGSMLCRPLQVKHWRERGLGEQEAQRPHDETTRWLLDYLGERPYWHREFMDEYYFPLAEGETEDEVGLALLATGNFRYVCPNWGLFPFNCPLNCPQPTDPLCPSDCKFGEEWHHERLETRAGWQIRKEGDDDIIVTFFDSGIFRPGSPPTEHPDLSNLAQYRRLGYNSVRYPVTLPPPGWEDPNDISAVDMVDFIGPAGHGIPVAGAAAATGNNAEGVCGIGWSLRHRMVKVVDSGNFGQPLAYAANVWHGMEIAAAEGDRVFSYSWHTADCRPDQGGSCDEAVEQFWQAWEDNTVELKQTYPDLLIFIAGGNAAENYCYKYSAMIWLAEPC